MNETSMVETLPPTSSETILSSYSMEELTFLGEEGLLLPFNSKTSAILRSVSSIVSVIASSVLIWMILRSKKRLTIPYHRILLGMSIADILYSISNSHFNALIPDDLDYIVWNARGNLASCITVGFLSITGLWCAVFYAISLNIYFLLAVKYNKKDKEVNSKYDKWLHGLPIGIALVMSIAMVSNKNINADTFGTCQQTVYYAPHCDGIEPGEIREGFEIPCDRGITNDAGYRAYQAVNFILYFGVPIIILTTLFMLYIFVKNQENTMTRYGAGALDITTPQPPVENSRGSSGVITSITSSLRSSISSLLRSRKSSAANNNTKSRMFLTRAQLFSGAYFVTWIWTMIINAWFLATEGWGYPPAAIMYLFSFFSYFQGFFNFLIFLYPRVKDAKKEDISWWGAIVKVFRPEAKVSKFSKQTFGKKASSKTSGPTKRTIPIVSPPIQEEEEVDEEIPEQMPPENEALDNGSVDLSPTSPGDTSS